MFPSAVPHAYRVLVDTDVIVVGAGLAGLVRLLGLPLNEEPSNKTHNIPSMTQRVS